MSTELPRRVEGGKIRIPVSLEPDGGVGDGAAEIGPDDPEYAEWDAYLRARVNDAQKAADAGPKVTA